MRRGLISAGVSGAAGALYRYGAMDLCSTIAVQTSVHVAGLMIVCWVFLFTWSVTRISGAGRESEQF